MENNPIHSSRIIVKRIRKIRKTKQYSQEFVASKLGISQEAYSRMELNETTPSIERLLSIAYILEIPPDDLLFTTA